MTKGKLSTIFEVSVREQLRTREDTVLSMVNEMAAAFGISAHEQVIARIAMRRMYERALGDLVKCLESRLSPLAHELVQKPKYEPETEDQI